MKSFLESIITEKQQQPPPIGIVYGLPGVGKTTFGASLDKVLIIDCENGANNVNAHKTPYLKTWQQVKNIVDSLITEKHDYQTVVIDSLDWCFRRIIEHIIGDDTVVISEAKGGYGKGYQHIANLIYGTFIPMFNHLNQKRNMSIIFLAHTKQETVINADGIDVQKLAPDVYCGKKENEFIAIFTEWVDFVFYMRFIQDERIFQTLGNSRIIAKSRIKIPDKIKVSEYKKYFINEDKGGQPEKKK